MIRTHVYTDLKTGDMEVKPYTVKGYESMGASIQIGGATASMHMMIDIDEARDLAAKIQIAVREAEAINARLVAEGVMA